MCWASDPQKLFSFELLEYSAKLVGSKRRQDKRHVAKPLLVFAELYEWFLADQKQNTFENLITCNPVSNSAQMRSDSTTDVVTIQTMPQQHYLWLSIKWAVQSPNYFPLES
ncbi:uncharacterized protein AKAW2_31467A [Aspergillus luchuensis]|uniref:Uncharacterized protein n=1 Tax=Aspergillus kawachii TaxID=1069201 RepID=A0A7R7ZX87_ASPKA|nr:uncharacterized protein AKAW2_31467A [Aspergillus luchuensis]BCR98148.1 hypothetical protein AKAW2_31467A [Aspergillus luchuensis]